MAIKSYEAFKPPSPYEQERRRAEQQRRYAELLQQQALAEEEPFTYQGIRAMPSPLTALTKMLQAYGSKKALEKAEEAEQKAKEADIAGVSELQRSLGPQTQVVEPDMFADPMEMASKYTPPRTETTMPSFQQRESLLTNALASGTPSSQRLAQLMLSRQPQMTMDALMSASPESRRKYQETGDPSVLELPLKETAPMVTGGMYRDPKTGQWNEIPGYTEQQRSIAAARRPDVAPKDERLVAILGADGKPTYVRESEAVGKTPFTAKTLAQETVEAAAAQANAQREIDTQSALDNIGELIAHPGRRAATGKSSFVSIVPGTDAYDFAAKLDTFKAQTFIPMVSALKGMGALSDAEGKKLQAAVGALDPSMSEEAFVKELEKVATTLATKAKAAGLNVTMPANMSSVIDLPPRKR